MKIIIKGTKEEIAEFINITQIQQINNKVIKTNPPITRKHLQSILSPIKDEDNSFKHSP